jgi:hypothetical protein
MTLNGHPDPGFAGYCTRRAKVADCVGQPGLADTVESAGRRTCYNAEIHAS